MSWHVLNLRKLGDGGNGDVYLGERSDTGETVVVKYLRDHANPDNRRWFAREIRILARHLHARLVPFLGGDAEADRPYYIMPYCPGGSLTKWCGRLTPDQLRACAIQIGEALAALHSNNIAHGDVKPDNILTTRDGNLQVGDPLGNGGGCTVLFTVNGGGTPGYWAPEVSQGGPISRSADVFSFGATLYHLATGRRPVDGQNLDPWSVNAAAPKYIRELTLACANKIPAARPTMQEVVARLQYRQEQIAAPVQPVKQGTFLEDLIRVAAFFGVVILGAALLSGAAKGSKR